MRVAPRFLLFGLLPRICEVGCVVVMPHTLCPRGSITNDRGEGPIEAFPTNQISPGSLFRMRFFFSFVPGRASPAAGSLLRDILFLHQKCPFVVGGSFLEILREIESLDTVESAYAQFLNYYN